MPDKQTAEPNKKGFGVKTISITDYQPAMDDLYRSLLGKEPEYDSHTGEMIYRPWRPRTAPAVGASPNAPMG